jgi:hypothetical protein
VQEIRAIFKFNFKATCAARKKKEKGDTSVKVCISYKPLDMRWNVLDGRSAHSKCMLTTQMDKEQNLVNDNQSPKTGVELT